MLRSVFAAAALMASTSLAYADNPAVGGAAMLESQNIIENAVNSPIHTTLVAAVTAAGLVETLQGPGPFTVFAPTDEAFAALPEGTVETLLMPENKDMLVKVLTCHVAGTNAMAADMMSMIESGSGAIQIETLGGCMLTAEMDGDWLTLTDENGGMAHVTVADVVQSNGVIHVIDAVLLPAM